MNRRRLVLIVISAVSLSLSAAQYDLRHDGEVLVLARPNTVQAGQIYSEVTYGEEWARDALQITFQAPRQVPAEVWVRLPDAKSMQGCVVRFGDGETANVRMSIVLRNGNEVRVIVYAPAAIQDVQLPDCREE